MLSLARLTPIHLCTQPTDMRKSFNGLAAMTESIIGRDPLSGHLFVFVNRRGNIVKILAWDGDGYAIWMKRLERGTFQIPQATGNQVTLTSSELSLILGGVDLESVRHRKRYQRPSTSP